VKAIVLLGMLAAIDIAATTHAILTRHAPHVAAAKSTTPSTGSPTVMSVSAALGCATSALLLVAIVCVIIDARWAARRPAPEDQPPDGAVKVIDV
jgi:hypothetical protein